MEQKNVFLQHYLGQLGPQFQKEAILQKRYKPLIYDGIKN